jgi:hypothetical protein
MKKYIAICSIVFTVALTASAQYGTGVLQTNPVNAPFLQVDLNGNGGPTQPGFTAWNIAGGNTPANSINNTFGSVGVTITENSSNGQNAGARNRGTMGTETWSPLYQDFYYTPHNSSDGFGVDYLSIAFTGLSASTTYEFTFWSFDVNSSANNNYMAWGTVNPATYYAGIGYANGYTPQSAQAPGGAQGAPILGRSFMGSTYPSNFQNPEYSAAADFFVTTDGSGDATIYGWNDSVTYTGQQASIINGFAIAIPEPSTLALMGGALVMLGVIRRRK